VIFGSLRPGEELVAFTAARVLAGTGLRLLVAPRHRAGEAGARAALVGLGLSIVSRDETSARAEPLAAWLARLASAPAATVGMLCTRGELGAAYESAAIALVGGSFAPYGGHSALEPAARGCPVIVGPNHGEILPAVEGLLAHGGARVVCGGGELAGALAEWSGAPSLRDAAGEGARRAAAEASRSAERALAALHAFGLGP
jgi:3-deoxy-D-manno-octulosonic-acid transferase